MSSTPTPDDVGDRAGPVLFALADERGAQDADDHLPPGLTRPTPGEAAVLAKGDVLQTDLRRVQHNEVRDLRTTRSRNLATLEAHEDGQPVIVPDSVPLKKVVAFEAVPLLIIGFGETLALTHPVGTILDLPMDSIERFFIPAVLAILAAVLSHMHGFHTMQANQATAPQEQDAQRTIARRYALTVVGVGASAVIARVFAADLDSQLSGGVPVPPEGMAFFVAFQLAFVFGSLALARSYHGRVGDALDVRLRTWIDELRASIPDLEERLANAADRHSLQRQQLVETIGAATLRYFTTLSEQHPDVQARVAWADRIARSRPTPPPPPGPGPAGATGPLTGRGPDAAAPGPGPAGADPGPEDETHQRRNGDARRPGRPTNPGPTPPPGAGPGAGAGAGGAEDPTLDEEDLIEAILNPRPRP